MFSLPVQVPPQLPAQVFHRQLAPRPDPAILAPAWRDFIPAPGELDPLDVAAGAGLDVAADYGEKLAAGAGLAALASGSLAGGVGAITAAGASLASGATAIASSLAAAAPAAIPLTLAASLGLAAVDIVGDIWGGPDLSWTQVATDPVAQLQHVQMLAAHPEMMASAKAIKRNLRETGSKFADGV